MCSRKIRLILKDQQQQRFHKAEQMGSRAENTKHVSRAENTPWQLCCVILKVFSDVDLSMSATLHPLAKTLKTSRGKSASITLLWNKSGQIAFFFFLADPFLGAAILPGCFWKKRRKSGWSATVLAREQEAAEEEVVAKASHPLFIQDAACDDPGQSGLNDRQRWI